MSADRRDRCKKVLTLAAFVVAALSLAGCSSQIADMGTPDGASARPNEQGSYLPVNALPPDRDDAAMDPATRAKLEAEMIAARDRQAAASAASTAPSPTTPSK